MLFAIALSAAAHAQNHVEVQLDDAVVGDLVDAMLTMYAPCGEEAKCPDGVEGPCIIDHLEIAGPVQLSGAGQVQAVVPLEQHVTCVGDPSCTPTPTWAPPLIATLEVQYFDVDPDPVGEYFQGFLCAQVPGVTTQCVALPLEPLALVPLYSQWGLSAASGVLALRLDNPLDTAEWSAFNGGSFPVPMPTEPGSMFLGWEVFRMQADARLATVSLPAGVSLSGQTDYTWEADGLHGTLRMSVPWDWNAPLMSGSFEVTTVITHDPTLAPCVSGPGSCSRLVVDITADLDIDEEWGTPLPTDVAVLEGIVTALAAAFDTPEHLCTLHSDWHMTCYQEVDPLSFTFGGPSGTSLSSTLDLQPAWMWADATGIALGGPVEVTRPELWVEMAVDEPVYGVHGSCSNAFAGWDGTIHVWGHHDRCEVDFDHSGYWLSPALVSGNELGWHDASWSVVPLPPAAPPAGDNALYATVVTNAGVRSVAVPLPDAPTAAEAADAEASALGKQLNCAQMFAPYVKLPWLEEMIAPIDPFRDRLVHVLDAGGMPRGVAGISGLAFQHHDDGTVWIVGQLAADAGDETALYDFSFVAGDFGREEPEAVEEYLLEEGVLGAVLLPAELGEAEGLFVEVLVQQGADHESYWVELFAEGSEDARAR